VETSVSAGSTIISTVSHPYLLEMRTLGETRFKPDERPHGENPRQADGGLVSRWHGGHDIPSSHWRRERKPTDRKGPGRS
jgi:hypothetical protein